MKVELRNITLRIEPGYVFEGEDEQHIEEAIRELFNGELPIGIIVDGIECARAADYRVSVHADDILEGDATMFDMDGARARDREAQKLQPDMFGGGA